MKFRLNLDEVKTIEHIKSVLSLLDLSFDIKDKKKIAELKSFGLIKKG